MLACAALSMSGCDYLDYDETTGRTKEEAYGYFDNMNSLVAHIYSFLPTEIGSNKDTGAMMESATDNSVYTWEDHGVYNIINGKWSPLVRIDDGWTYWEGIRSANSFLENYKKETLDRFQYNSDYTEYIKKAEKFTAEVKFLRAFFLFELAKRYNDIPLITKVYTEDEINSVEKTSFDDVIKFIADECDAVAEELPEHQSEVADETGRITKGAALALKSRALLYAASPLHNPDNDPLKWEAAAKAAYQVISLGIYEMPNITSDPLYSDKGGNDILTSKQLILERRATDMSSTFEKRNQPMGFRDALGGNTPSQNLVDAYEMSDGTPFDWDDPNDVANMYYNSNGDPTRDPRLYLNVLTNQSKWKGVEVETFSQGKHMVLDGSTKTGYYLRKFMNPQVSFEPTSQVSMYHHYILFRYAEVLLNYAEAMNEWKGPDATAEGASITASTALNQVRTAANMLNVTETDPDKFRERVRNERRIELAFEGHRFFDIRRWKIAGDESVRRVYGVKINKSGDSFSYQRVHLYDLYWKDKMYLYPFPQNEVYMNDKLTQNPGWDE